LHLLTALVLLRAGRGADPSQGCAVL